MVYKLGPNSFEMVAKGTASPEAQIEYLMNLQQIHMNEIETLQVRLSTLKLEGRLQEAELLKQIDALGIVIRTLERSRGGVVEPPNKKSRWKFWRGK